MGRKIVEEAARRGSKNYRFVLDLLNRGAELRKTKTEDPVLLLREREDLLESPRKGHSLQGASPDAAKNRGSLLRQRDAFIGAAINTPLKRWRDGRALHRRRGRRGPPPGR